MQLFYSELINEKNILLDEQDSKHCSKVLRMQPKDELLVTDGKGFLYKTIIIDNHPKKTVVEISEKIFHEPRSFNLHIAVAPTKNIARMEWLLEKATEIGIEKITPIICHHSERKIVKRDRLQKIIVSAAKQSLKYNFPVLEEQMSLKAFLDRDFGSAEKFIGWCDNSVESSLKEAYTLNSNALILIGPEGDFSNQEIIQAKNKGFLPIMMGKSRLRTETAALVACHTINLLNE